MLEPEKTSLKVASFQLPRYIEYLFFLSVQYSEWWWCLKNASVHSTHRQPPTFDGDYTHSFSSAVLAPLFSLYTYNLPVSVHLPFEAFFLSLNRAESITISCSLCHCKTTFGTDNFEPVYDFLKSRINAGLNLEFGSGCDWNGSAGDYEPRCI